MYTITQISNVVEFWLDVLEHHGAASLLGSSRPYIMQVVREHSVQVKNTAKLCRDDSLAGGIRISTGQYPFFHLQSFQTAFSKGPLAASEGVSLLRCVGIGG